MPPAPGAVAMAAMVDPCIVVPFCPGPLAAGAMGCWGPPGGQSCRENALSDFTAYFTTFFRKKIHPPMGFSTSSEILVEKRRRIILILWYRKVCGPPGAAFSQEGPLSGGTLSGSLCSPAPPRGELLCIYWSAVIDLPLWGRWHGVSRDGEDFSLDVCALLVTASPSPSPSVTPLPKGEALAKPFTLQFCQKVYRPAKGSPFGRAGKSAGFD